MSLGGAVESMLAWDVLSLSQQAESPRKALVENMKIFQLQFSRLLPLKIH